MWSTSGCVLMGLCGLMMLSCRELNPAFCEGHPDDTSCPPIPIVDASLCTRNEQCASPTPICDREGGACVECTAAEASACSGTAPVCGADHACRGCAADSECASLTCLPDGACAMPLNVLYAKP